MEDNNNYKMITVTSNLPELEDSMKNWSMQPHKIRMRSDERCIEKYGVTNYELYEQLKSSIILNQDMINTNLTDLKESAGIEFGDSSEDEQFIWKKQITAQLCQTPNIVILSPFDSNLSRDEKIELLNSEWERYCLLTPKFKNLSNSYSLDIWGYNVPNMYNALRSELFNSNSDLKINTEETFITPLNSLVERMTYEKDKISLVKLSKVIEEKTDSVYYNSLLENAYNSLKEGLNEKYFIEDIPKIVPWFTVTEMNDMNIEFNHDSKSYYSALKEAKREYDDTHSANSESTLLSLGWNPEIPLTEKAFEFARRKQLNWLNENSVNIIDLTKQVVSESSINMRKLYNENNLHPIYIVLSYKYTAFGKVIRAVKKSTYTHAGICLDSDLKEIYSFSFGMVPKIKSGICIESIEQYRLESSNGILAVLCVFVDGDIKEKIRNNIQSFINNKSKTSYGFGNLFNILINRSIDTDENNLSLVCSQFVDTILKLSNIDITNKTSNLVIPEDFLKCAAHPKVYKLYDDIISHYNERIIEGRINSLFNIYGSNVIFSENALENYIKPESILEFKLPIKFSNDGDMIVDLFKSLEDQYQESHRILKQYTNDNSEGIKTELAKLFYINATIEKKVKKMNKADEEYKKHMDLRARVLNDFKKYFKIIVDTEPDFDFSEYLKTSDYNRNTLKVDKSVFKTSGKLIKKFIKSLGK